MNISFPYGTDYQTYDIPESRYAGTLLSRMHEVHPAQTPQELVEEAFRHPIGTKPLRELAAGKQNIVILASDHTRPVPSRLIMPPMLRELRSGSRDAKITILIATGCHRTTTKDELRAKFGDAIVDSETICIHDCDDEENLVELGTLPSGGTLRLNRLAAEADLLVAEGFIEPHFFAGFSGGRKSVLPGIAARKTVIYNHNAAFIADPCARTGILEGNPIHRDMLFAAKAAKLAFICNVVLDSDKNPVFAVCGDAELAHLEGCRYLRERCAVKAVPSDIVITTNGGYPLDQNIYQAVKGMTAAEATVRPGGVIIMLARSNDGHGGESFHRTFRDQPDLSRMMEDFLRTPAEETIIDQWQSQIFARVLLRASVIYISDAPDVLVRELHMLPAHSIGQAVSMADALLAERGIRNGSILAIPDGVSVIVEEESV